MDPSARRARPHLKFLILQFSLNCYNLPFLSTKMILFSYFMHVASKWMQCVEVMLLLEILAVFTACKNNKLKKTSRFSHLFESNFKPCRHGTLNAPGLCWMPHGTWSINTLRQFHTMDMVLEQTHSRCRKPQSQLFYWFHWIATMPAQVDPSHMAEN